MRIIYNRHFPFGRFYAINLFGVVISKSHMGKLSSREINHEYIHTLQQREMLYVGFYVWYVLEWLWWLGRYRNLYRAYHRISFEREAYDHEKELEYKQTRRHFAWLRNKKPHL